MLGSCPDQKLIPITARRNQFEPGGIKFEAARGRQSPDQTLIPAFRLSTQVKANKRKDTD